MKRIHPQESWPELWKSCYVYDLEEIYGEVTNAGYVEAYHARRKVTLDLVSAALPKGARLLDLGAAQGNFSLALAELGYRVTWNDLRAEMADYVQLKYERGEIAYAPGNAFDLDFPEPFDGIIMTEIIEHVAHPDDFLANAARMLRPGGYIVMSTPNGGYFLNKLPKFSDCPDPARYESVQFKPNSDGHIFLLHPEEVGVLAERAGLVMEKLRLFTSPITIGHKKTGRLHRIFPRGIIQAQEKAVQWLPFALRRKISFMMAALFRKPE